MSFCLGRICLDTLKMPPQVSKIFYKYKVYTIIVYTFHNNSIIKGSWSPSINLNTLLLTIRLLMGAPNADDGLMPDIVRY